MLSSTEIRSIQEAYASIYTKTIEEDFDILEELTDGEFEEIVEEVVCELLDEGYEEDEIEYIFDEEFDEILEAMTPKQKEMRAKFKAQQAKDDAAISQSKRANLRAKAVADTKAKVKGTVKRGIEKAGAAAKEVKDTAKRKTAQAKGAVASAALKATGTKLKGKKGQDLTPQQTHTQHKSVRDKAKAAIKAKIKGKVSDAKSAVKSAGRAAVDDVRQTAKAARKVGSDAKAAIKSAPGRAAGAVKRGIKGLIRRGAEKVASGATKVAKRMSEEVETFDLVVEFLCDYGIAEDLQEAQWLMVNEVDSEDIATILEAYGIDEANRGD
jgi:hypothetical protein